MPEHIWSVVCHRGCLDTYTNLVSLLEVTEGLTIRAVGEPIPAPDVTAIATLPSPLHIVSLWTRSDINAPESFQLRSVLITPDGTEFAAPGAGVGDLKEHHRLRSFLQAPGLPVRGPGTYRVAVEWRRDDESRWERVARIPFEVRFEIVKSAASPETTSAPVAPSSPAVAPKRQRRVYKSRIHRRRKSTA
jgi:hypothetical protein